MRFLVVLLLLPFGVFAQDTLRLTIRQTDSLFVRNNLSLLADRFRVDAAQAGLLQTSLRENPTVTVEASAYNGARQRVLDVGGQGQKIVTVQQLLYTAGKRNRRIALAQEAARLTEFEFSDLLRNLRFEVRNRFYDSYFLNQTLVRYTRQIENLSVTVDAYEQQYGRNNVSLRDLLRLKALLFALKNDQLELQYQLAENQRTLRTLLGTDQSVDPVVNEVSLNRYRLNGYTTAALRELALKNRADLRASESLLRQADLNDKLQRSLARPDVRIGGVYDQSGSYTPHYTGLGLSIDLPVFNRNQGNIQAARSQIGFQKRQLDQKQLQISNEVATAVQKVLDVEQLAQSVESRFSEQFDELSQGATRSFGRGNLSLLEFVDLVEAYNENVRQLNRLKADRVAAYEELNYIVGDDLFQP